MTLSAAIRCADNKELDIRRPRASEGDRSSQMVSVEMALKANRCCFRTNTRFIGRGEPPKPTTRCARHKRDSHFKRLLRPTIQNPSSFKMHPRHLCSITHFILPYHTMVILNGRQVAFGSELIERQRSLHSEPTWNFRRHGWKDDFLNRDHCFLGVQPKR